MRAGCVDSPARLLLRAAAGLLLMSGLWTTGGCTVEVRGQKRPLLATTRIEPELELDAEYRRDTDRGTGVERDGEALALKEELHMRTQGDLYHPNLLTFNAAVGLGLVQQWFSYNEDTDTRYGTLSEYNLDAHLLRYKPYPSSFFLSKTDDIFPRQFLGPIRTETHSAGAVLDLQSEAWPMSFELFNRRIEQTPLGDLSAGTETQLAREANRLDRETTNFTYRLAHAFSEQSHLRFRFDNDDISQRRRGTDLETSRQRFLLTHEQLFGDEDQHRLDSLGEYRQESGLSDLRDGRWSERLQLRHSDSLLTHYTATFNGDQRDNLSTREYRGEAGFEHRLYDSLVTTGNVFASDIDFGDQGAQDLWGANGALNYRKANPWGRLEGRYNVTLVHDEFRGRTDTGIVLDERHVFRDPFPIVLDRPLVDLGSIVVTDSSGLITYFEGEDYTVDVVGGFVELTVDPFDPTPPNISDGQTLLIDYTFRTEPQRTEDTLRQQFWVRQDFDNGLFVYYEHTRNDDELDSTIETITVDEYQVNTVGTGYARGGLSLLAEYSERDSTRSPLNTTRLEGRYARELWGRVVASVHASQLWLDYLPPDERENRLFRTGGELSARLTDRWDWTAGADYRDESDSRVGPTTGVSLRSALRYGYRQLDSTVGVEYDVLDRQGQSTDSVYAYWRVRRFF